MLHDRPVSEPVPRFRQYRARANIAISALAAAVFVLRGSMSAARVASLSGPVWTILDGLLAAAFLIRCFDRIVVTPQGVTAYRVGIPRRIRAAGLHQFQVIVKSAKWSRLYAQTVDGERIPIAYERRTPHGQARMRQLWDHLQMFLEPQFRPLTPEAVAAEAAATAEAQGISAPSGGKHRCVRSGCPEYFAEVSVTECESCGSPTQRIFA
jgi:hypothetical protein